MTKKAIPEMHENRWCVTLSEVGSLVHKAQAVFLSGNRIPDGGRKGRSLASGHVESIDYGGSTDRGVRQDSAIAFSQQRGLRSCGTGGDLRFRNLAEEGAASSCGGWEGLARRIDGDSVTRDAKPQGC